MHIKDVVKELTCVLNKRRQRRSVERDPSLLKCTERVATLKRRLANLKKTITLTSDKDTEMEAAQRAQTVRCVEERLSVARKARHQCKTNIVARNRKATPKLNLCPRTLDEETLLNMLRHLLNRCGTELRGGEKGYNNHIPGRVAALWCEGEAIIAQREGRLCVANLRKDTSRSKNLDLQPKPFIKKVRWRAFKAAATAVAVASPSSPPPSQPIMCQ